MGVPENGWFIMGHSIKMDDLGLPHVTPISGKFHMLKQTKLKHVACLRNGDSPFSYRIWRQQNRGSMQIMLTNVKELAKEIRGISRENSSNGIKTERFT